MIRWNFGVVCLAVVSAAGGWTAGLAPRARADEIKLVEVAVTNKSDSDIYVWIDNTGRLGKDKEPASVAGPDGKPLPPGLIVPKGGPVSFGEAVGLGDAPTLHMYKVKDGKAQGSEYSVKVGPVPGGDIGGTIGSLVGGKPPASKLEYNGTEFKEVK